MNNHPYRAYISPIAEGTPRPLWSVMIPTYNCAHYLRQTLASVLAQDPGPDVMQIEVVDDCSTRDDPVAVVEELGRGRIGFYRQPRNVGHTRNFETCLNRSRGRLIHLLHGDDCVRDGFYQKMQQAFDACPEIGAAFCRHIFMDEHGHWQYISPLEQPERGILHHWLERIAVEQRIQYSSIVVRRDVYERLGGFDQRIHYYGEDWEMWIRIAAHYPVWYEVEPLALYRGHSASLSGHSERTGENIRDLRTVIRISQPCLQMYFPKTVRNTLRRKASKNCALMALNTAGSMLSRQDFVAAGAQVQEAVKCSRSWRVIRRMLRIFMSAGPNSTWQTIRLAVLSSNKNTYDSY